VALARRSVGYDDAACRWSCAGARPGSRHCEPTFPRNDSCATSAGERAEPVRRHRGGEHPRSHRHRDDGKDSNHWKVDHRCDRHGSRNHRAYLDVSDHDGLDDRADLNGHYEFDHDHADADGRNNRLAGPEEPAIRQTCVVVERNRVKLFNIFTAPVDYEEGDPAGYRAGMNRFGDELGAALLGGSVYELPPGQSICPYHYEYGNEEWLIVLEGAVILRHPEGEEELGRGDVVCFPEGPEGAHKVTNRGKVTARVLMISGKHEPSVAIYPDSDKLGVWPGDKRDNLLTLRSSAVDYWEGES